MKRIILSAAEKLKIGKIELSKREKIIAATVLITIGILFSTRLGNFIYLKEKLIILVGILTYFFSLWALWEGMTKIKAVVLLILPTLFTVAVASVYFLIPVRPPKLLWAAGFGLSFYLLLLSQNVFNVASIRTIPLYRVASTTSFLFSVFTAFILFNVSFALNFDFFLSGLITFIISFILALPIFWSISMEKITIPDILYSIITALIVGECAMALSFWPLAPTIWSLTLSTVLYITLGILVDMVRERLSRRIVWEYSAFGLIVLIISSLITTWNG